MGKQWSEKSRHCHRVIPKTVVASDGSRLGAGYVGVVSGDELGSYEGELLSLRGRSGVDGADFE